MPLTFVQPVVVGMSEGFKEVGVALQHVLKPGCLMGGQPPSHIAGRRKTVQRVVAGADHGGNPVSYAHLDVYKRQGLWTSWVAVM